MIALREFAKIINHKLILEIPSTFDYEDVEIIVLPRLLEADFWSSDEIDNIGKIGLNSNCLEFDNEDYSKW